MWARGAHLAHASCGADVMAAIDKAIARGLVYPWQWNARARAHSIMRVCVCVCVGGHSDTWRCGRHQENSSTYTTVGHNITGRAPPPAAARTRQMMHVICDGERIWPRNERRPGRHTGMRCGADSVRRRISYSIPRDYSATRAK